jgi:hypothetical protein
LYCNLARLGAMVKELSGSSKLAGTVTTLNDKLGQLALG